MAIYTKTGDGGTTSVYTGKRVLKSEPQVEACGSLDELNSFIGLVVSKINNKKKEEILLSVQRDLHQMMAVLSGAKIGLKRLSSNLKFFEQYIDERQSQLSKLNRFIIFQKEEIGCWFNILRTISRRAERRVVDFFKKSKTKTSQSKIILKYLNRLSDLFFVFARETSQEKEVLV